MARCLLPLHGALPAAVSLLLLRLACACRRRCRACRPAALCLDRAPCSAPPPAALPSPLHGMPHLGVCIGSGIGGWGARGEGRGARRCSTDLVTERVGCRRSSIDRLSVHKLLANNFEAGLPSPPSYLASISPSSSCLPPSHLSGAVRKEGRECIRSRRAGEQESGRQAAAACATGWVIVSS
jgi:hypothetical protein